MANRYFDTQAAPAGPPRLRAWRSYQKAPGITRIEVDVSREQEGFGYGPATLHVFFLDAEGAVLRHDEALWEDALDVWLLSQGARARDQATETLRASIRLRARFRTIQRQVGEGYFNSLVVCAILNGPLGEDHEVMETVRHIHALQPYDGGKVAQYLEEADQVLTGIAHELTDQLGYERPVAERIFADAVAMYLDERFHVSERLALFGR